MQVHKGIGRQSSKGTGESSVCSLKLSPIHFWKLSTRQPLLAFSINTIDAFLHATSLIQQVAIGKCVGIYLIPLVIPRGGARSF